MQEEIVNRWAALGKDALDSMKELGDINTRIIEKLTEQQQAIMNTYLEASTKEIKLLSEVKDAKDLLTKQSALVSEYNGKFVEIVRSLNDLLGECKNELTVWAEKGMEKAVTQFTQTSEK
jgi:phasin family protein